MAEVKVIQREILYQGRVLHAVREEIEYAGKRMWRETVEHPGAVAIVPFVDRNHILMVQQYRRAIRQELLELPAGTLEPDEDPLVCAHRELEEETGYKSSKISSLGAFFAAPGFCSEKMVLYLAEDLSLGKMNLDEDEFLEPIVVEFGDALHKVKTGLIQDGKTMLGLLLAEQYLQSI